MRETSLWVGLALLAVATLSGCAAPSEPTALPPSKEVKVADCPETNLEQVAYHNWTLAKDSNVDLRFPFTNITKLDFTFLVAADGVLVYSSDSPNDDVDWRLMHPNGEMVWRWPGSTGTALPNPVSGSPRAVFDEYWTGKDLGRVSGDWVLHLGGRSNGEGEFHLVGTSTPCSLTEAIEQPA